MPAFSAYQATQQTGISATVTTKITFDTKIFDTNNNFTSSRFTATIPGYYEISAGVGLQNASSTAYGQLTIYKNGAALINGAASVGITGALYPQSSGVTTVYLSVNDYVEIYFYCSGGGTVAVLNATYFQGVLVRAA
jgi:hypothetical protein